MSKDTLVSLLLIAYNQERFVREAVHSALVQTHSPLEIIISDDCSSDKTVDVIQEEVSGYRGPHRIVLNRNQQNLGLAGNLNRAWELSEGQFIVAQAGDDLSVPDRVNKLVQRWEEASVDLVCSYFAEIDVYGKPTGHVKTAVASIPDTSKSVITWSCGATGACAAYSRKLYEKYGPLNSRVISEDWVYPFRAWLENGIAVVEEPLVKHRTHENSISVMQRTVNDVQDIALKRARKRKGDEGSLAIAEEWLRAWQICGKNDPRIEDELQRLVRLRRMRFQAYDATRRDAFKLAIKYFRDGAGIVNAAKIIARHVFLWA